MIFEWDNAKAKSNLRKHRVSFQEAISVFEDPRIKARFDREDASGESRYLTFGISERGRLLAVCHVYRQGTIRIINARRATSGEEQEYA